MHRTKVLAGGLILGSALASTALLAADQVQVDPGQWQYSATLTGSHLPEPIVQKFSECVTPEMSKRTMVEMLTDFQRSSGCELSNVVQSTGKVTADTQCKNPNLPVAGEGNFVAVYDKTSFEIEGESSVTSGKTTAVVRYRHVGKRVGPCT